MGSDKAVGDPADDLLDACPGQAAFLGSQLRRLDTADLLRAVRGDLADGVAVESA